MDTPTEDSKTSQKAQEAAKQYEKNQTSSEKADVGKKADKSDASDQSEDSSGKLEEFKALASENEARYKYLYAEFDNFKKRAIKERTDAAKFGWESLARSLLEVIDNLDRALAHIPEGTDQSLVDGLVMVQKQFLGTFEKNGVSPIQTVGEVFDPNLHEAIAQQPSEEFEEGVIVHEQSRGYIPFTGDFYVPLRWSLARGNLRNLKKVTQTRNKILKLLLIFFNRVG